MFEEFEHTESVLVNSTGGVGVRGKDEIWYFTETYRFVKYF